MYHNGTNIGNGTMGSFIEGDIGQIAIDVDAGKVWFGRNGTFFANDGGSDGEPAAGTNESFSGLANAFRFALGSTNEASGGCVMKANFGEQGFKYTPPTGFKALSQDNLTTPTNFDALAGGLPEDYFKAVEYTGTGNSTSVTGLNFRLPIFVWIKNHTTAGWSNQISDSVRGDNNLIFSDANNGNTQNNGGGYLTSFDANGFTVSGGGALVQMVHLISHGVSKQVLLLQLTLLVLETHQHLVRL